MEAALPAPLPLQRFELFRSHDVDEARDFVARIFCPHELSSVRPHARLDVRHHNASLHRNASLNYVQYGAEVQISPGYLRDFYLLQVPLRGGASVRCGRQRVESATSLASFPSPTEPLSMRWAEASPQLIVKFDRVALATRLEALLQMSLTDPLVFDLGVDLRQPAARSMVGFLNFLRSAVEDDALAARHAAEAEEHLLTSTLLSLRHNYSARLASGATPSGGPPVVLPRIVKRAQDFMSAQLELPISLADVCGQVGVSARALQQAFQLGTGSSPMAWLRNLRLDHVRAELLTGPSPAGVQRAATVSIIAARYGFFHLGHFSAHYRTRFGETPSETLRRRSMGDEATAASSGARRR
jgi:AraC-like DNA-binding protein